MKIGYRKLDFHGENCGIVWKYTLLFHALLFQFVHLSGTTQSTRLLDDT
jgi:hypothetical protein